jgi:hypothetical protein
VTQYKQVEWEQLLLLLEEQLPQLQVQGLL